MSRKDFELIAAVLKARRDHIGSAYTELLAADFADRLTATNAAFDRARFLKACGC
jgi:hypothetical protein